MKVQLFSKAKFVLTALVSLFFLGLLVGCLPAGGESKSKEGKKRDDSETQEDSREQEHTSEEISRETSDVVLYPPLDDKDAVTFLSDYGRSVKASEVTISTSYGTIAVRLYDDTPLHRANFLYLIERKYYTKTSIVRVVPDFVIQGGNSEEREDQRKRNLIGDYTLPAEFRDHYIHKRGALAMSRSYTENPQKRSSAYDFYISLGKPLSQTTLYTTSLENQRTYTEAQKQVYMQTGGTPHLDNEHTVFGEVIRGMEVVERISRVDRDASDWPREHIEVRMEIVK